jgi:hypothetical protein
LHRFRARHCHSLNLYGCYDLKGRDLNVTTQLPKHPTQFIAVRLVSLSTFAGLENARGWCELPLLRKGSDGQV